MITLKTKAIIIVLVALLASMYSYLDYQKQVTQIVALQSSAASQDEAASSPPAAPSAKQKPQSHIGLEQQLQKQFQQQAQQASNQSTLASDVNPFDEDLVTEVQATGHNTPSHSLYKLILFLVTKVSAHAKSEAD